MKKALIFIGLLSSPLYALTPPSQISTYTLVFNDDFTSLNLKGGAWFPGVWFASNTAPSSNFIQSGSTATLIWNSNNVNPPAVTEMETFSTYNAWRYGYFETRMKWDVDVGAWPAFWLIPIEDALGQDNYGGTIESGELDVFEGQGASSTTYYGTVHDWINYVDHPSSPNFYSLPNGTDLSQYHTYGALWVPGQISWYFDNQQVLTSTTPAVMDKQTYFMVLSMQEGANWTAGSLTGVTASSMTTVVDWVHVWQFLPPTTSKCGSF